MPLRHRCDACRIIGTVAKPNVPENPRKFYKILVNPENPT